MNPVLRGFLLYVSAMQIVVAAFGTIEHPASTSPFFGVVVLALACFAITWLHTPKARARGAGW